MLVCLATLSLQLVSGTELRRSENRPIHQLARDINQECARQQRRRLLRKGARITIQKQNLIDSVQSCYNCMCDLEGDYRKKINSFITNAVETELDDWKCNTELSVVPQPLQDLSRAEKLWLDAGAAMRRVIMRMSECEFTKFTWKRKTKYLIECFYQYTMHPQFDDAVAGDLKLFVQKDLNSYDDSNDEFVWTRKRKEALGSLNNRVQKSKDEEIARRKQQTKRKTQQKVDEMARLKNRMAHLRNEPSYKRRPGASSQMGSLEELQEKRRSEYLEASNNRNLFSRCFTHKHQCRTCNDVFEGEEAFVRHKCVSED